MNPSRTTPITLAAFWFLLALFAIPQLEAAPTYKVRTEFPETDGQVYVITVDSDHSIVYVGGNYSEVGGLPRENVAAIDAISGDVLPWNPGANNGVFTIAVKGNVIYLGGSFTEVAGTTRNRAAAVNPAGALLSWNPNVGSNSNEYVYGIAPTDLAVYLCGNFFTVGGVNRFTLASVQPTSGAPLLWNPSSEFVPKSVTPWKGNLYVCGSFTMIGGQNRTALAPVDLNGNVLPWIPAPNSSVWSLIPHGDSLYAAGSFTSISGVNRGRLARFLEDGSVPPFGTSTDDETSALAIVGSTLYAGGQFTAANGQARAGLLSTDLNGALLPWSPPVTGEVFALGGHGPTVFAGGKFTAVGGIPRMGFAAIYDPAQLPVPLLTVKGRKKITTSQGSVKLRGLSLNAVRVEVKAGKGGFSNANGVAIWNHRARLKPGKNVILVQSVNIADATSRLSRITVTRR
jgi:trimeric autotransporter adhesin